MKVDIAISNAPVSRNGFPTVAVSIPEFGAREVLDASFADIYEDLGTPSPVSLDLVLIAGITYVLDKAVPRRWADDFWTREFSVDFPVSDPCLWSGLADPLASALEFLTGDEWDVGFAPFPQGVDFSSQERFGSLSGIQAVSLFSGGIDSLVGTIDYLSAHSGTMVLVGHHDGTGAAGDQIRLHDMLDALPAYKGRTTLRRIRVRPLPLAYARQGERVERAGREHTLRSRSFLFLALGLCAANTLGPEMPLLVPENGYIAINAPLTPSRIGTCSTRTAHPYFVRQVAELALGAGLRNPISNPLELKTKGEAVAECRDQEALAGLLPFSVSCAHSTRRATWQRRSARNCGYCVPCLARRAALHHIAADSGEQYGVDALAGELDIEANRAADLRAVLDCLCQVRSLSEVDNRVLMTGPIPQERLEKVVKMVHRGLEELRSLVRDKGEARLKRIAGLR